MAEHARLDVLKAAAVTIPFVRIVERSVSVIDADLGVLRPAMALVVGRARKHRGGIGAFLAASANDLQAVLELLSGLAQATVELVQELIRVWRERELLDAEPHLYADENNLDPSALDRAVRACIPELGDAFDFLGELVAGLLAAENLYLPEIIWSTSVETSVGGECTVRDRGATLSNVVTLILPESGFDKSRLYQIPYLLAHELICHASQGIFGPFPRNGSGPACAWSDGWMDCLAFETIVDVIDGDDPRLPEWISDAGGLVAKFSADAHAARYPYFEGMDSKEKTAMQLRHEAKEIWKDFKAAVVQAGRSEEAAEGMRRSLSIRYNAVNLAPKVRGRFLAGLLRKLVDERRSVARAIEDFLKSGNVDVLHDAFRRPT